MALTDKIEYLLDCGKSSAWGERISAELAFLKSISDAKEKRYDAVIEASVDALICDIDAAGGVITGDRCVHGRYLPYRARTALRCCLY